MKDGMFKSESETKKEDIQKLKPVFDDILSNHPHEFYDNHFEDDLDLWEKRRFPYQWILEDEIKESNVKLFYDISYGFTVLVINDDIDHISKNGFVMSRCESYIGLTSSYGVEPGRLYMKQNK